MEKIFTLRLDEATSQRLQQLADQTLRSRAGVVRWLINQAVQDNLHLSSGSCVVEEDKTTSSAHPHVALGR